jgi:hypothetical protein
LARGVGPGLAGRPGDGQPGMGQTRAALARRGASPAQDDPLREDSGDVPPTTEDATAQVSSTPEPEDREPGGPEDPLTEGPQALAPSPSEDREERDESGSDSPNGPGPPRRRDHRPPPRSSEQPEARAACGASSGGARNGQGKTQRKLVRWFDRMLTSLGEGRSPESKHSQRRLWELAWFLMQSASVSKETGEPATLADLRPLMGSVPSVGEGYILAARISGIAACERVGKTRFALDLARWIWHGLPWPNGQPPSFPARMPTLWVCADGISSAASTWTARTPARGSRPQWIRRSRWADRSGGTPRVFDGRVVRLADTPIEDSGRATRHFQRGPWAATKGTRKRGRLRVALTPLRVSVCAARAEWTQTRRGVSATLSQSPSLPGLTILLSGRDAQGESSRVRNSDQSPATGHWSKWSIPWGRGFWQDRPDYCHCHYCQNPGGNCGSNTRATATATTAKTQGGNSGSSLDSGGFSDTLLGCGILTSPRQLVTGQNGQNPRLQNCDQSTATGHWSKWSKP